MRSDSVFRFSTDELPEHERLARWREVIGRRHMRMDIEPQGALSASISARRLPSADMAFVESSPARYLRTRELLQDGNADFSFARVVRAGFTISGAGVEENFAAGEAAVVFHGKEACFDLREPATVGAIRINGDLLRQAMRDLDERLVHRLTADNTALRLLGSYMQSVTHNGVPDEPALAHLIGTHLIDLVVFGMRPNAETGERAAGAVQAARLAAIRADVLANLGQVRLSAKTIARQQGVSERYVYLLFEQNGLSFSRFVMEERLKRAMTMLLDPACAALRISDIAYAAGFGDLTTFNRAFRQRYGGTPRAIRRGSARGD
jgi:AraC-like DNA-binding protein